MLVSPRTRQSDRPWGVRGKGKFSFLRLPVEFTRELQAAGGVGSGDGSEVGVTKVGIRFEEVRMAKGIEHLETELEALRLCEPSSQSPVREDWTGTSVRCRM